MRLAAVVRREPRAIAFGLLHTVAATAGQTFLVSLFLPGMTASFGLTASSVSLLFTSTTLVSAAALWKAGGWIDRTDLLRYSLVSGLMLAASCVLLAAAAGFPALVAGMLCLRLAGNGLLTHVAVTATARYFSRDRGAALAIVMLGSSIGEGVLPALLVPLIAGWGWRATLAALGLFALTLVLFAGRAVRDDAPFRRVPAVVPRAAGRPELPAASDRANLRYFLLTSPLFAGMWIFVTATIFHQARVAEANGMSLQWFAVSFVAFAAVRMPVSLLTGRLVDRLGSAWLLCLHLVPLACGTLVLVTTHTRWGAPLYWLCAGVTSGMGTVLQATVVAERVPRERLGRARSMLGAMGIVASAIGPTLYGVALDAGVAVHAILASSVLFFAVATALGIVATREQSGSGASRR